MKINKLPESRKKLMIETDWCGDDQCNCHFVKLYSVDKDNKRTFLWRSNYVNFGGLRYKDDEQELREEVQTKAKEYGVSLNLEGNFWDWEDDN